MAKITVSGYPTVAFDGWIRTCFSNDNKYEMPKRYIINENAAILFWRDGSKTVVKRMKKDKHDKRMAFLTAYFQKNCGMNKTKANKFIDDLLDDGTNVKIK